MKNSAALHARALQVSPGGVHGAARYYQPHPQFFSRMEGQFLWDVDDNRFLDLHGSFGAVALGHNDPEVREQVSAVLAGEGVLFGTPHRREVELAESLVELLPCADMVALCGGGGSDPLYFGFRLARAVTGRRLLLKFEGEYHGWNDPLAVSVHPEVGSAGPREDPRAVPASAGAAEGTSQVVIGHLNDTDFLERQFERWGSDLACAVIEPVCHTSGAIEVAPAFLKRLRDLCTKHGVVLMFDEVITGFRHSVHGAHAIVGVTPDLAAFGKALGNGFPISLLAGRRDLMENLTPLGGALYSGTYCGHLISVAAAQATLAKMRREEIHLRTFGLGSRMVEGIAQAVRESGAVAVCQGFGSIYCLYFGATTVQTYRDVPIGDAVAQLNSKYRMALLDGGVFMHPNFVNRSFLTAQHREEDVDRVVDITSAFLAAHADEINASAESFQGATP